LAPYSAKNCKGDDSTAQGNVKELGHTNKSKSTNEHAKHKTTLTIS